MDVLERGVVRSGCDDSGVFLGGSNGEGRRRCDAGTLDASGATRRASGEPRGRRAVVRRAGGGDKKIATPWGEEGLTAPPIGGLRIAITQQ